MYVNIYWGLTAFCSQEESRNCLLHHVATAVRVDFETYVGLHKTVKIRRYSDEVCLHYDSRYFFPIDILSRAGRPEV